MKAAPTVIFLFKDEDGVGASFFNSLQPDPSSSLRRLEDSFELSLEHYGIKECKARGELVHFVQGDGAYQVSMLLMQSYEPPVLACALNEVLTQLVGAKSQFLPTFLVPFAATSSKLKWENKSLPLDSSNSSIYSLQMGRETDIIRAITVQTKKPPLSLQIHHEPLACFFQLIHVLELPAVVLICQIGGGFSDGGSTEVLETLHKLGKLLANNLDLCFYEDKVVWNPSKKSRDGEQPWRALYG